MNIKRNKKHVAKYQIFFQILAVSFNREWYNSKKVKLIGYQSLSVNCTKT